MSSSNTLMKLKNGVKKYSHDGIEIRALDNVNVEINNGEIVVILGASGSGKTTLLNILAGLDTLDEGEYTFGDTLNKDIHSKNMSLLRKDSFGFIFQSYNLLEHLSAIQNVRVGAMLNKFVTEAEILELLKLVGLESKKDSQIYELSGGEQQRVAIARALAKKPSVLFCDEPTGALDEQTSKEILKLMIDLNNKLKTTMITVTHNPIIANIADKIIIMRDGKMEQQRMNERKDVIDLDWGFWQE